MIKEEENMESVLGSVRNFERFTSTLDGQTIYINPDYVVKIDRVAMGTRILLANGGIAIVRDDFKDVVDRLTGC